MPHLVHRAPFVAACAISACVAPAWAQAVAALEPWERHPLAAALLAMLCLVLLLGAAALRWLQTLRAQQATHLARTLLEHSPQLVALLDSEGRVLRLNQAAREWVGPPYNQREGAPTKLDAGWRHDPLEGERLRRAIAEAAQGQPMRLESTWNLPCEAPRYLEIHLRRVTGGGHPVEVLLEARDITERREAEDRLRLTATVLDNAKEGVLIAGAGWRMLSANNAFQRISGMAEAELMQLSLRQLARMLSEPALRRRVLRALRAEGHWEGELDCLRHPGQIYTAWVSITVRERALAQHGYALLLINDITEWKRAQSQIRRHARFDALTDLPNRESFIERLQWTLASATPQPAAVLRLNVDQYHTLTHHISYQAGDAAVMEVGQRLRVALREADTVARLGGEEFAVLLPATQADGAAQVAAKLMEVAAAPMAIDGHDFALTLSVGVALAPTDGRGADELMRAANAAIHRARHEGQGLCRFYDPDCEQRSLRHLQLESALRKAVPRGELLLHYQPQLKADGETVVGLEALVRWRHPELGLISPGEFIPLAESSGQIGAIGDWVMREAARQMAEWLAGGLPPLVMAVNLSALQFRDPQLLDKVRAVLHDTGLPPACLELELTESVAMQSPAAAIAVMDALQSLGVRLAIDDFGTGYSSLAYLKRFRIHTLKIDQGFVRDISTDGDDRAIVRAIIDLARAMHLKTVAEGVETEAQAAFLREGGCHMVQGYLYCRPQDAATTRAWLAQRLAQPGAATKVSAVVA